MYRVVKIVDNLDKSKILKTEDARRAAIERQKKANCEKVFKEYSLFKEFPMVLKKVLRVSHHIYLHKNSYISVTK